MVFITGQRGTSYWTEVFQEKGWEYHQWLLVQAKCMHQPNKVVIKQGIISLSLPVNLHVRIIVGFWIFALASKYYKPKICIYFCCWKLWIWVWNSCERYLSILKSNSKWLKNLPLGFLLPRILSSQGYAKLMIQHWYQTVYIAYRTYSNYLLRD